MATNSSSLDLFNAGCLCWRVFFKMCQGQMREKIFCSANQRGIFAEIVTMAFREGKIICPWSLAAMCSKNHNILKGIVLRFFNCMYKNFLRSTNEVETGRASRKIRKLTKKNAKN